MHNLEILDLERKTPSLRYRTYAVNVDVRLVNPVDVYSDVEFARWLNGGKRCLVWTETLMKGALPIVQRLSFVWSESGRRGKETSCNLFL